MDETFLDFTNSDAVMDGLTKSLAWLIRDVTGYQVVEADETIPKPDGNFVLVDLTALTPLDWATNEVVDEDGYTHVAHNYVAGFTLTAYRGKPHWAISRVHQAFGLPFMREKYFPTGSPYAYSSTSSIARIRVPLNQQLYENRARVLINFNVCFVEKDVGKFEDVDRIVIGIGVDNSSGEALQGIEAESDIEVVPGGNDDDQGLPPEENPPLKYHDQVVTVCIKTPVVEGDNAPGDKMGE